MNSLIFIDSDILFSFFALNKQKKENFERDGMTGDDNFDIIINLIEEIENNELIICLSEISILEILCVLNRRNSASKIPKILKKIYSIGNILPIDDLLYKMAWFIGSNYKLHTGDALHLSFCLMNDINELIIRDKEFYDASIELKTNFQEKGFESLDNFFMGISFVKNIPERIKKKFSNLKDLRIRQI